MYAEQKVRYDYGNCLDAQMTNWVKAVEQTHIDEAYYDMILQQPPREHKRMLKVFQELDA